MMAPREELQTLLKNVLGSDHVYFQPPPTVQMSYPCIVYKRDDVTTLFAANMPYQNMKRYLVTVIDKDPDSKIPSKIAALRSCIFDRFYTADNLNHDVFKLFF
jgi:hypothetical protein